jgi:hypothetical protein
VHHPMHSDHGVSWLGPAKGKRMSGNEDQSDDYGYDLAHEVKAYLATPPSGRPVVRPSTTGTHRDPDPNAEFGYDEAHGF